MNEEYGYITRRGVIMKIGNGFLDATTKGFHNYDFMKEKKHIGYRFICDGDRREVVIRAFNMPSENQIRTVIGFGVPIQFERFDDYFSTNNPIEFPIKLSKIKW